MNKLLKMSLFHPINTIRLISKALNDCTISVCSCEIYEKRMILCYSEKYRYIVRVKNGISGQIAILNIYKELFPYFWYS